MTSMTRTHTTNRTLLGLSNARFGGPRRRSPRAERLNEFMTGTSRGSHMPIDAGIHWELRNPLNIIPAFLLLVVVLAIASSLVSLLG